MSNIQIINRSPRKPNDDLEDFKNVTRWGDGNPTASNLFDVICALEKKEKVHHQLHPVH